MSVKKYAGEEAVERLSEYIKRKLESVTVMPSNPIDGTKVIYIGDTDNLFTQGDIYKWNADNNEWVKITYSAPEIDELLGNTIQVDELPTASADELGNIYEFVGTTTANYINGRFYRCVSDGEVTPTYSWEEVDFGDGTPHWSGTRAEYEAVKNTLEAGTYVSITDDYDDGLEVVDVIESGNMNPVTSNAVAEALPKATYGTEIIQISDDVTLSMYWQKFGKVVVLNLLFEGIPTSGEGTISNIQIPSALRPAMRHSGQKTILNWGTLNVGCALLTSTSEMRLDYAGNSDKGSGQIVLVTD